MLEVAVLGSILVFSLATLLRVGMRFNYQQQLQQDAFRKALQTAQTNNTAAKTVQSYKYLNIQDRQVPNPADPFAVSARTRFGSSSTITYGRFLFETMGGSKKENDQRTGQTVLQVDDQTRNYRDDELSDPDDENHDDDPPLFATVTRSTTVPATGSIEKTESGGAITTTRDSSVTEQIDTVINKRDNAQETITSTLVKDVGVTWETPR